MAIEIIRERPDSPIAQKVIGELDAELMPLYAIEDRHGYSVEKLLRQQVAFFVLYYGEEPAGCGGVQFFADGYGELKRMYIRPAYRRRGLARIMLEHLERYAHSHSIPLLRLETGIYQLDAIRLYEGQGYTQVGPFGEYRATSYSLFYEKRILRGEL